MSHEHFMRRCLELADLGRGKVGTNPLVGAVLVRSGKIIAEGWHNAFGNDHAERDLFNPSRRSLCHAEEGAPACRKAGSEAVSKHKSGLLRVTVKEDDVLYVNLEPCSHHGKTPPCTELIIEKRIQTVVYGMRDPNPEVAGQGIQILRDAGIQAIGPIDPVRCKRFNRGFVSLHEQQRPWITIKQAQTRDGRIANKDLSAEALAKAGSLPLKITSEKQDAWSHEYLRAKHDAILVGVETIVRDDPQLTVRLKPVDRSAGRESSNKKSVQVDPLRIVLDPNCRVPLDAQIIGEGTCIVTAESADVPSGLEERGATVIKVPFDGKTLDFTALWSVLITPKDNFYGITSILVEGGPKTWETFRKANIVDEEVVLVG